MVLYLVSGLCVKSMPRKKRAVVAADALKLIAWYNPYTHYNPYLSYQVQLYSLPILLGMIRVKITVSTVPYIY
jgi:hypothetical protein